MSSDPAHKQESHTRLHVVCPRDVQFDGAFLPRRALNCVVLDIACRIVVSRAYELDARVSRI